MESFKQFNIDRILTIPPQKPDLESIVKTTYTIECVSQKIINTPIGTSASGQTLTGRKLIIEGEIRITMQYINTSETSCGHAAHFVVPFSTSVVLCPSTSICCPNRNFDCLLEVEDLYVEKYTNRAVYLNATVLARA
ncbi:MAG: SPOCS domain-containing protein [Bacilli bacterium]